MKHRQKVLDLRPTQFAIGMLEVEEKIKIARGYGKKQRRDYIQVKRKGRAIAMRAGL